MLDVLMWIVLIAVLAGAGYVGYVFLTGQTGGLGGMGSVFGPKPERRLDVVEQMTIDARRKLVIVRRDDVEHLIMTGGPVDVVIETGIGERPQRAAPAVAAESVYSRPARSFGIAPSSAAVGTAGGKAAE